MDECLQIVILDNLFCKLSFRTTILHWEWAKGHFNEWVAFSSIPEWVLPVPETKVWGHFMNQIYPGLEEKIAPETDSVHWKVGFLPSAERKILLFSLLLWWWKGQWERSQSCQVYVKCVCLFSHVLIKFITFMTFVMLRGTMREVSNLLVWGNFANYTSCVSQLPAFSSIKRRWGKVLKRLKLNCFERNIIISRDVIWDNLRPKL